MFIINRLHLVGVSRWPLNKEDISVVLSHTLSGLKQQKCLLSHCWSLRVQNQNVGRARLSRNLLGREASLPLPASSGPRYFWFIDT